MNISEIATSSPEILYQLLGRLQADCRYYLGYGGRSPKHLWAGSEREQIRWMRTIYRRLRDAYAAPEWISAKEIDDYAALMLVE